MNQMYLEKNLPAFLQFSIRPMLLISLGLHGLLLMMPVSSETKIQPPKKEEKVKISQLPPTATSPSPKAALPSPQTSLPPSPKLSPVATQPILRPSVPARQQPVASPVRQPSQTPQPKLTPTPQVQQKPSPQPSQSASPQASPSPSPQASQQPVTPADPFAEFPRYPNAQPGSAGVLKPEYDKGYVFNKTEALEQVATNFEKLLQAKGFTPAAATGDATFKVYQVSKGDAAPQFLHLISQDGKTVMLLAPQAYSLDALKNSQVEQQTAEERALDTAFKEVDDELVLSAINITDLVDPNKFSSVQLGGLLGKAKQKTPEELGSYLQSKLSLKGFVVSPLGDYGGGKLYKISQNNFITYLSLVPTQDGKGTAILTLKNPPT